MWFKKSKKTYSDSRAADAVLKVLYKDKKGAILNILDKKNIYWDENKYENIRKLLIEEKLVTGEPGFTSISYGEVGYKDKDFLQKQEHLKPDYVKISDKGKHFMSSGQKLAHEEILLKKEKIYERWIGAVITIVITIVAGSIVWVIKTHFIDNI